MANAHYVAHTSQALIKPETYFAMLRGMIFINEMQNHSESICT